ncbi:hypothetical protein PIB30_044498 [Stylosanthes scabra]|uniref:Uncharacterized protein n=1 Tax=Stylosanthes scabra TaxID=79078 RepID=A0ABU6YDA0_9FABA|nr:hypothetical protein [Stylosanthes scabra]
MEGDESFVALVHHDGKIKYKSREGVKFTDKSPISRGSNDELFVEVADSLASSGGSAPNPRPVNAGGPSGSRHQPEIDVPQVASPIRRLILT